MADRFDRPVVGSGDGIFVDLVHGVRRQATPAWVVAQDRCRSRRLASAASRVVRIDLTDPDGTDGSPLALAAGPAAVAFAPAWQGPGMNDGDWTELSRRAGVASHRLVGWIYWDPVGVEHYAALGVPDGIGYYIATRGAPLGDAGNAVVTAAYYSIHPDFVAASLDLCRQYTTFAAAAGARDVAVVAGLQQYGPEICDDLASMAAPLWAAADSLTPAGRPLYAAHQAWPRPDDPLLSAWLAVNCIREWRADTHWAIHVAENIDGVTAGVLDGAWRAYEGEWVARSRGADDDSIVEALAGLEHRGLATAGAVTGEGITYRQELEDRLDRICAAAWRTLGEDGTRRFLDLVEPVGPTLMARVDATAGPNWMPAGRDRRT